MDAPKPNYALALFLEDCNVVKGQNGTDVYFAVHSLPSVGDLVAVENESYEILKLRYHLEQMNGAYVEAIVRKANW